METHPDQQEQNNPQILSERAAYNFWDANRLLIKGIVIGILILIMLSPRLSYPTWYKSVQNDSNR